MKLLRSRSLGLCLLAMVLVLAIIATLLGASTAFQNSGWLILMGLALFVLAGMPALRDLMGPSPSESPGVERRISGRRNSNSLVAVSAAAILAVYAAGYDKTNSAADRLEEQSSIPRRHAVSAVVPDVAAPVASASLAASASPTKAVPAADRASERIAQEAAPATAIESSGTPSPKTAGNEAASADAVQPSAPQVVEAVVLTAAAAPEPPAVAPAPAPPVPAAVPPVPAQPQYNDGSFLGWGTCRHGRLQVQVVIQAGKIFSAEITQCLTRYSCSVIQNTPSQLVARQNPDKIDNVTGATQSVDAYYFAVTEALKEAAQPLK